MHQAPIDAGDWLDVSRLRLESTPLHRTADRLTFPAGCKLGAGAFVNDTVPKQTAAALREAVARSAGQRPATARRCRSSESRGVGTEPRRRRVRPSVDLMASAVIGRPR